jgi:hypothetical protein
MGQKEALVVKLPWAPLRFIIDFLAVSITLMMDNLQRLLGCCCLYF